MHYLSDSTSSIVGGFLAAISTEQIAAIVATSLVAPLAKGLIVKGLNFLKSLISKSKN